ncbi:hypothetical protein F511_11204 [Dorcoceras hygrometricum]|uniref:Uncharacterized protein n=1 Tax=Dorcoceras hygrometricum TaxID=472368 RepID=A0A2Z7D0R7_9LAMI|nr:hypothetical protein F511_11204 [Dorcoceras hygrometricum]
MSRFFFVKRVGKKRDPWKCDMSWRDNIYTFTPRNPERSSNLASFLDAMREMHFNAPELIKEDLLCFFGFSRKGVELVEDLDERMGKAAMLKAMEEAEAASSGAAAPLTKAAKKRKASTPAEKEARRQKKKKGASTSEARPVDTAEKRRSPTPPIPTTEERPAPMPVITIAPDRDIGRLSGASNAEAVGLFSSNLTVALAWGGEVIKRLTRAQREASDLRWSFDDTVEHVIELETRLTEVEAAWAEEARATEVHRAALETRELRLEAEKAALLSEKKALAIEKEALEAEKGEMRTELDETKARAEEEVGRLRSEAINAWDLSKEEFLKSSEFDTLCAKKALGYFKVGFAGCVAQFRANGYSEEEHSAPFLDVKKALMEMPDENEEAEEEEGEEDASEDEATPPSPPPQ